jgi:hypothetical protein
MKNVLVQFAQKIDLEDVPGIEQVTEDVLLVNILNTTYFLGGLIAVIVIIIAGLAFINSGGDASRVAKAKNQILYAVIGIIVILVAFTITNFVIGSF